MAEYIERNALIDALMQYTWRDKGEPIPDDWFCMGGERRESEEQT